MKRYLLLIGLLLLVAGNVSAQTATPTTSPYVHYQGYYPAFREYNAGRLTISGTWSVPGAGYETILQTTQVNAWAALTVSDTICTIGVIHSSTSTLVSFYINGTSVLSYAATTPNVGYTGVIDTSAVNGDFQFKIQMINAGTLNIYQLHLIECGDTYPVSSTPFVPVPTATILPSSTPFVPVPTATILPSSTPFVPVPTATILPSSTPFVPVPTATRIASSTPAPTWTHAPYMTVVPTATILPSSTPGVPTATILPSSTPANTPVDTATAIATSTPINIDDILTLIAATPGDTPTPTNTPTETHTPTATFTPTDAPWVEITLTTGQMTRFDYVASASDVHVGNLLLAIFVSLWGFFLSGVFFWWKAKNQWRR
jgi:hypothetical protein